MASPPPRRAEEAAERRAAWRVPADAREFEGHFPGRPVLPGVAQLGRLLEEVGADLGRPLRLLAVRGLRWRRPVGPEAALELTWTAPTPEGWLRFRVTEASAVVSEGRLRVAPHD